MKLAIYGRMLCSILCCLLLLTGCASSMAIGVALCEPMAPIPMGGTILDFCALIDTSNKIDFELMVLAAIDLLPSFALDVCTLPVTFPLWLVFQER